jgi:hypothetical protein
MRMTRCLKPLHVKCSRSSSRRAGQAATAVYAVTVFIARLLTDTPYLIYNCRLNETLKIIKFLDFVHRPVF